MEPGARHNEDGLGAVFITKDVEGHPTLTLPHVASTASYVAREEEVPVVVRTASRGEQLHLLPEEGQLPHEDHLPYFHLLHLQKHVD